MRCEAQSKQTGNRCKRSSIPGGTVCSMHGGKTPAVIAERSEMATMALKMGDLCQRVQFGTVNNRALRTASCQSQVRQQAHLSLSSSKMGIYGERPDDVILNFT